MHVVTDDRGRVLARSRSLAGAHRASRRRNHAGSVGRDANLAAGDSAKLAEIAGHVEKYLGILGASHLARPRIVLRDNLGSSWLGRDEWRSGAPETTTMMIQRSVLGDARTLERIVAHETAHHVDSVLHGAEMLPLLRLGLYEGHGRSFLDLAERVNAVMGQCFVTVTSDKEYVQDAVCKTYFVVIVPMGPGKYAYAWAARPSKQQQEEIAKHQVQRGAVIVSVTDPRWTNGAKIKKYGGVSIPKSEEDQAKLRSLYEGGALREHVAARLTG